jgi:hypothetical protein
MMPTLVYVREEPQSLVIQNNFPISEQQLLVVSPVATPAHRT